LETAPTQIINYFSGFKQNPVPLFSAALYSGQSRVAYIVGNRLPELHDGWPSNAALLLSVDPLPFATSQVSSTLFYWWLDLKGVQDTPPMATVAA
jgi:hypothetical protein